MKNLLFVAFLAFTINGFSQTDKTVSLVVSGQGKTQDEAKQNALRSAIEQAFGVFISSKIEILNDNLVKDEIVSVASGNIQKYEVISVVQIPNGDYATSLNATVSVSKLTSFAESKGVVAEFKGSLLAANVKQQILNEQNEIKSIDNIKNICKEILDLSCDFGIVRGEPKQKNNDNNNWAIPLTVNVKLNKNIELFNEFFIKSIKGLAMSNDEVLQYNQLGKKTYKIVLGGSKISESTNVIFNFRSITTIVSIIDLIYYLKHSLLNWEIYNGLDIVSPEKLINDLKSRKWNGNKYVYDKGYGFKILNDNLNPIFNARCEYSNFKYTSNGPNGIFGSYNGNGNTGCGKGPSIVSLYEPLNVYDNNFYYNGGRSGSFQPLYTTNYAFLVSAESVLPKEILGLNYEHDKGYQAVISLFDFKNNGNNVSVFYYEDNLTLNEIEKVEEYKISPILKK